MSIQLVRKRFSSILKELYRKYGDEKTSTEFYNSFSSLRQESVSKIANDKQAIRDTMILELLQIDSNISLEWLFTGEGSMFKTPVNQVEENLIAYNERVLRLEAKVSKLESLLEETLNLTNQDLTNRKMEK